MVHSTQPFMRCSPSTKLTTNIDGVPVVKAAFNSCIGVDVHHSILVCAYQYCDRDKDEIHTELREFATSATALREFAAWCRTCSPERIVLESTGILWVSPYQALEDIGFTKQTLALINARDFKAIVGRKTDKQDAQRLAEYGRIGKIRASFVPERRFREQRMIARYYSKLVGDFARRKSRFIKLFNFAGCRVTNAFSDINGKSARKIVEAFLAGANDLYAVVEQYGKRLRKSPEEIVDALQFAISEPIRKQLLSMRTGLDRAESEIATQFELLREMQAGDQALIDLIMDIPGIKEPAARLILAEVSNDLSSFPNSEHFASWAGVCPGNNESAGKSRNARAAKGNRHLRSVLIECAQAVGISKNNPLGPRFQAFKERRGHRRAVVATAHLLLRIIYNVIRGRKTYRYRRYQALRKVRVSRYLNSVRNVKGLNFEILEHGVLLNKETGAIVALSP